MSPQRVSITMPANGVIPIDVSMHLPSLTAVIEAPLPMWQVIIFDFSPTISAAFCATNLCDVPCAP